MDQDEHDRLAALPQAEKNAAIRHELDVIHASTNSGSVDPAPINASLERIAAMVENVPVPAAKPETKPAAPAKPAVKAKKKR